jgi:hypothetical protein
LKDGRVACKVPQKFKTAFKGKLESIDDTEFVEVP